MYEGAPNHPREDRFWEIVEKYRVSVFYTAPTAIRAFIKWGDHWPQGTISPACGCSAASASRSTPKPGCGITEVIGGGRCPIVDTWWQTETGAIMIAPLPGAVSTKPGSATKPLPGIFADVVDKSGRTVPTNQGGLLVITRPWPSMMRTIYGDDERYKATYWSQVPGVYFTADGARRDEDGYIWVMGRVDDVLNVAGHRLSTMEVESALVHHPKVAEAAVVGRPDALKGEGIVCFVTLRQGIPPGDDMKNELKAHVVQNIGSLARPDEVRFTDALAENAQREDHAPTPARHRRGQGEHQDTTTLEDYTVLAKLRSEEE